MPRWKKITGVIAEGVHVQWTKRYVSRTYAWGNRATFGPKNLKSRATHSNENMDASAPAVNAMTRFLRLAVQRSKPVTTTKPLQVGMGRAHGPKNSTIARGNAFSRLITVAFAVAKAWGATRASAKEKDTLATGSATTEIIIVHAVGTVVIVAVKKVLNNSSTARSANAQILLLLHHPPPPRSHPRTMAARKQKAVKKSV